MTTLTNSQLSSLVITALERTAFVLADAIDADDAEQFEPLTHAAVITYSGPSTGRLVLHAGEGFMRGLAASLLGIEPEDIDLEREGTEALRELANIVGGCITHELGGVHSTFSLGLPELTPIGESPRADDQSTVCYLDAEDELLSVAWIPDAGANARAA